MTANHQSNTLPVPTMTNQSAQQSTPAKRHTPLDLIAELLFMAKIQGRRKESNEFIEKALDIVRVLATREDEVALVTRLSALADELDAELDSGAKWSKAQHTCCSVSVALRAMTSPAPD